MLLQVEGLDRLGSLGRMENLWYHVDVTPGVFRVEFTDGRRAGEAVLGPSFPTCAEPRALSLPHT